MSEQEHLDDQLRNGTDYANLPAHMFPTDRAPTWIRKIEIDHLQIDSKRLLFSSIYNCSNRSSTTGNSFSSSS